MTVTLEVLYHSKRTTFENVDAEMVVKDFIAQRVVPAFFLEGGSPSQGFQVHWGRGPKSSASKIGDVEGTLRLYDRESAALRRELRRALQVQGDRINQHTSNAAANTDKEIEEHIDTALERSVRGYPAQSGRRKRVVAESIDEETREQANGDAMAES